MLGEHLESYRNICCSVTIQKSIIQVTIDPWPLILCGPGRKVTVRVSIRANCQGFAQKCVECPSSKTGRNWLDQLLRSKSNVKFNILLSNGWDRRHPGFIFSLTYSKNSKPDLVILNSSFPHLWRILKKMEGGRGKALKATHKHSKGDTKRS